MARPNLSRARRVARQLHQKHLGEPTARPVDVEQIIVGEGISLRKESLEYGTFGIYMRQEGRRAIVVDPFQQGAQRLLFTLAHELGHASLLDKDGCLVDGYRKRDALSTMGTHRDEVEANAFAAELLMPETLIRELAERAGRVEESDVRGLAKKFGVSPMAMTVRLNSMGFFIW